MQIGPYKLDNQLILAPMAGITDRPFRELCRKFGAGLAVSEMVASNPALRQHKRTLLKADHNGESAPRSVQIVGTNPKDMADAARFNASRGAHIIDINMGCPAKKVCSVAAGSALLKNESLVKEILETVVAAVDVPVTLKIRTGWDPDNRNAVNIANIAENAGIAALAVHGRTRACGFSGQVEYNTIRQVKQSVTIPVIANGDISSPEKAKSVLDFTGADAIMIGRAAQGRPWVFNEMDHYLEHGKKAPSPSVAKIREIILTHLEQLYCFYGDTSGVRIARKHIKWYFKNLGQLSEAKRYGILETCQPAQQLSLVDSAFSYNQRAA